MFTGIRNKFNVHLLKPLGKFLMSGMSPEKLALTFALGLAISIFPILGPTTIMCFAVAYVLKLNPAAIQLVNYLAYPLQILCILPYYQAGAWLFGNGSFDMTIEEMTALAKNDFVQFFDTFLWASLHAMSVWCLFTPLLVLIVYYSALPPLQGMLKKLKDRHSEAKDITIDVI